MSRTQDLLEKKWSGGAEAPRSLAADTQPVAPQPSVGGSRTQRMLAGRNITTQSDPAETHAQRVASRDDAGVRSSFAQRHPEMTGGEVGTGLPQALETQDQKILDRFAKRHPEMSRRQAEAEFKRLESELAEVKAQQAAAKEGLDQESARQREGQNADAVRADTEIIGVDGGASTGKWKHGEKKAEYNRWTKKVKELEAALYDDGLLSRIGDTVIGGAKGAVGSTANAMTTMYEMGQGGRDRENQELLQQYADELERAERALKELEAAHTEDPKRFTAGEVQSQRSIVEAARMKYDAMAKVVGEGVQQRATDASYGLADDIQEAADVDVSRAKKGLGGVGEVLVDAGASMTQSTIDGAVSALLGAPQSMLPFAFRAFGGGTQQARQDGAESLSDQALYGAAMAVKEVFTEKMFNMALPYRAAYGSGSLDDAVERGISKAVDKYAKTELGKRALGGALTLGAGAAGEGLEEYIGDWMEWQMPRIYGGDVATAEETAEKAAYDFLVGFASGALGGSITPDVYRYGVDNMETQKTASTGEAGRMQLVEFTDQERLNLSSGSRNKIVSGFENLVRFVRDALGDGQNIDRAYMGKLPESVVSMVREQTGMDISGFSAMMNGNDVRHIMKDHSDPVKEAALGQLPVTPSDIAKIEQILADPERVKLSPRRDSKGRAVLEFSKEFDGRHITLQAISAGKHLLQTDTMYIKKKNSQDTGHNAADGDPVINAQSVPSQSSSDPSIPQTAQDVNAQAETRMQELERGIAELDQQRLERGKEGLGTQGQATLAAMYLEGQDAGPYVQGMRELYAAGQNGVAMETVESEAVQSLNDHQRRAAYEAGRMDARAKVAENKRRANFAKVAGKEKGLVWDSYVEQNVDPKVADKLNEVAKRLNVRVHFVDSVLDGRANGQIVEADIRIAKDTEQPIMTVFGHEVGHYLETTAPEAYQAIRQFATQHHAEEINAMMELYAQAGQAQDLDGIQKEYINDEIGRMIEDGQVLAAFIEANRQNRTLLQQVADALRALWQKLTGKDRQKVKAAEEALLAALKASEGQAAKLERAGQVMDFAQESEGGKYKIKTLPDGKKYVQADRQVIFGQDTESWRTQLEDYINGKIRNNENVQLIGADGDVLTLTADTAGKVSSPFRGDGTRLSDAEYERKVSAGAHIDELAQVSRSQGKQKRDVGGRHGDFASQGWDYRSTYFQDFDGKYYLIHISAAIGNDGKVVYNIGQMQERSLPTVDGSSAKGGALKGEKTSPKDSIPQPADNVNGDFSLKGSEVLTREVEQVMEQSRQEGWSQEQTQEEIRAAVQSTLQSLVEKYGAIKPGENPAREVEVPRRTAKNEKVSQTVRTILEAGATPETAVPTIEELTVKGEFSYRALADKTAMERAEQTIQHKGWGASLADWLEAVKGGSVSKDNTAMGWALYNQAANTGDIQTAMEILQRMVLHQRSAAQAVQATRILKQMSPEAQLYGAQRSVESLQEELNERYGDKKAPRLTIDEELARRLLEARDQETRDGVLRDIYRDVGRQLPSTLADKWNAWRYLSMLGNVRTHVRNIMGNAGFVPVVAVKDMTATAIERVVYAVSGGRLERSKGFVGLGAKGRGLLAAAWGDYANVEEAALSGGKYGEFQSANRYIEEGRVIFKSKPGKVLEAARKANSTALDVEDVWFSRPHYAYAMAQYCTAHGIAEETIRTGDAAALEKAREYAIKEAQKATYRDTNALSQMLGGLGRDLRQSKNAVSRAAGLVVEGVLPFRKTPANILARGLEYSPLGLVKGLSYDLAQVKQGNMTGAEVIDHVSAGLTGTGLLALGVYLAAQGLLRGKGPGDDKERELEKLQGHQDYSLELGDISITLDWLAPEALPLFVGVNLWEEMQRDGDVSMSDMLTAVSNVSDPVLEMSCLQSLNDIFDSVGYAGQNETNPLTAALVSGATSYLTQGLPTIFGQAERVFETQRETTYTSKDAFLTGDMQYFLGKVSGKVPGWEFQQIPYIDAWGRTESTGSLGQRAVNNMLNPAYVSSIESSRVEEELERLYNATGEGGVFPTRARKYFQVDGKRRDLSAEEYVDYATRKGQTARKVVEALVGKQWYGSLDNGEKAEAVKDAYQYAEQTARQGVAKEYAPDSWVVKAQEAEKRYKIPVETYILLRQRTAALESIKGKDGEAIANSKGLQIMEAVYETPGLGDKQRGYLFEALGVGKSIQHYNKAKVKEDLEKLRKQAK